MNQKNSLGIDLCFKDLDNPIDLFEDWFNEAKKTEINDPNALALATVVSIFLCIIREEAMLESIDFLCGAFLLK